jgi:hypothetical protein
VSKKKEQPQPAPHDCRLDICAVKTLGSAALFDAARTVVVLRCAEGGCISHHILPGHWTMAELGKR